MQRTHPKPRRTGGELTSDGVVRRRVVVRGRVQGVWFRESTRIEADRAGATGWVRNLPDGSVEAEVEGAPEVVDLMLAFLRTGPPSARVAGIEVTDVPVAGGAGFDVRH